MSSQESIELSQVREDFLAGQSTSLTFQSHIGAVSSKLTAVGNQEPGENLHNPHIHVSACGQESFQLLHCRLE